MKIVDNSPIDEPCIGRLIKEDCSVGQFLDNCFYLIADEESSFAQKAVSLMKQYQARNEMLFNNYELEVVRSVELMNHPKLKRCIEQDGDNLLIQLGTPAYKGKKFVVAKTDEGKFMKDLCLMIYAAERITRYHIGEAIKDFATEHTDEFVELARNAINDKVFQANYFAGLADRVMQPSFGMAASKALLKEQLKIKGGVTHQQRMEMFARFLDNLKGYRKSQDPKIAAELDFVISTIDIVTLRMFFLKQSPQLQEKINNYINPQRMAEVSTMNVEVRRAKSIDAHCKSNGYYRLYLVRGDEVQMVHFTRRNGFVLYLIYLLDRKKNGDKVDTLNLSQYKELFGKLYYMAYRLEGERFFVDMMKNYNANNEVQQKGIYTVLKSIRDDVGSTCERMREPAEPFLLRDIASHLAVLPSRIVLPDEILTLTEC